MSNNTILFIRDEMLANPHSDANTVYNIAKLAEEDSTMFNLMMGWMNEISNSGKKIIEEEMVEYMQERGLF